MASPLLNEILAHYRQHPNHIEPFIGDAYASPSRKGLRIMTVGINAYASSPDWDAQRGLPNPRWFSGWFRDRSNRFAKRVQAESRKLAEALSETSALLAGREVAFPDAWFHTNAIPFFVHESEGKRADQLPDELFAEHAGGFMSQLRIMARHDALPHVIMVFGEPFWRHACKALQEAHKGPDPDLVRAYRSCTGPCLHHANRLDLAGANSIEPTLLVRLRHPSARTSVGSARWLLEQPAFRALAGIPGSR